ncbi:uncharacterized protein FA14DRAFT_161221 [Meira miltonrushii]|uniref:VWFA domain-containing protein n=1 Tax=Meira miltonrushii TaxID=1280837 RepID=A0A316V782_9BASI|nr:uncharacterized protein FA14DRAFT_161221 [Meira miltonrushii]PWN33302.1 hypothetical protein FA14DRAFT_161221 [Meira miltonrushii]
MAGKRAELLASLTQDIGKMIGALHSSQLGGQSDIASGINIAQLALKHRENKSLRQRILVFVGSPIPDSEADLIKLGKKLKKNNVAVDIINFGEIEENEAKLNAFVENVNSGENSHLLTVPASHKLLSDQIISSPILMESDGAGPSGSGAAGGSGTSNQFEFGVDPSMDPELAMALRMSLEEEQARQRAAEGGSAPTELPTVLESANESSTAAPESNAKMPSAGSLVLPGADAITGAGNAASDEGEDAMLQQAIALSRGNQAGDIAAKEDVEMDTKNQQEDEDEEMDEEEAIARAIEMSLKGQGDRPAGEGSG